MVLRDDLGKLHAAASFYAGHQLDAQVAEALCFKWTLQLCCNLQCSKIIFETDCLAIKKAWDSTIQPLSYFSDIMKDCKSLAGCFAESIISHTPRDGNKPADFLSKLAYRVGSSLV